MPSSSDTMPPSAASPDTAAAPPREVGRRGVGFGIHRFVPALAAFAVLVALAAFQADRAAAPETGFLALWSAAVLLPAAALARARFWETALGPVLAVLAVWALPAGTARSTVLGALLVGALAVAGAAAWSGWTRRNEAERVSGLVAAALGAQMLLRSERLLAPDAVDLLVLLALPAIAGLALSRLAAHRGLGLALIAAAAALALGPGWTLGSTAALVAVVMGAEWAAGRRSPWVLIIGGALLAGGLVPATRLTLIAVLAGWVVACDRRQSPVPPGEAGETRWRARRREWAALACAALAAAAAWWAALRTAAEAAALLAWAPVLLPALLWAAVPWPGRPSGRRPPFLLIVAAAVAAVAAALAAPGSVALAAPLAALAVLGVDLPAWAAWPQRLWSAAIVAATALLASYPWLRRSPAEDALGLWGLGGAAEGSPGWGAALAVVAAVAGVTAAGWGLARAGRRRETALALALALLVGPIAVRPIGRDLGSHPGVDSAHPAAALPVVLTAERPRWSIELPAPERPGETTVERTGPARLVLVSHLSNGALLAPGQVVATVRRVAAGESQAESRPLRAGVDTAEWALRRPDVAAALGGGAAPPHWSAWLQPGQPGQPGQEPFFGQRYRAVLRFADGLAPGRIEIERAEGLPDEVTLTVHRVEVVE